MNMAWNGIVAVDGSFGIGRNGTLPWRHKADLSQFRRKTTGGIVVMGGSTFRSIGRPLAHRVNVVLSSTIDPRELGTAVKGIAHVARNAREAEAVVANVCEGARRPPSVWVIGGAEIYKLFHDKIKTWHVTLVKGEYHCDRSIVPYWLDQERYREDTCDVLDDRASVTVYSSK